ncbi:MAG: hypothetical protein H6736_20590 [Alphaproteobacteria bacterium]|nr:hypothetical protein [Alphaproteobacteria bacterium]
MILALLLACGDRENPDAVYAIYPEALGIPASPVDRGSPAIVHEAFPAIPTTVVTHADGRGLWTLAWEGAGWDADLRDVPEAGLSLSLRATPDAEPAAFAPPPLPFADRDGFAARAGDLQFLPSTGLAFLIDDQLFFDDGEGWTVRTYSEPDGLARIRAVERERVVHTRTDGPVLLTEYDGQVVERTRPPFAVDGVREVPWNLGPVEGSVARTVWLPWGQVCTGRWDLVADTLSDVGCIDLETPVAFGSTVGGDLERGAVLLTADSVLRDFTLLVHVDDGGPVIVGELPATEADAGLFDDPTDDRLPLLDENGPLAWITADGGHVRLADALPAELLLGADCDASDPYGDWCLPRTIVAATQRSGSGAWTVGREPNHDARGRWFATLGAPEPTALPLTPFTGGTVLADGFAVSLPDAFGMPLPEACLTARGPDGTPVVRVDGVWRVDETTAYTVELDACELGDGGPPVVGATMLSEPGLFDPFALQGFDLARGWALDALDDPPEVVVDASIPGLLVREAAGWTSIARDPGGIARTVVDLPSAAAPRLLPDGRFLLEDGTLYDGTGSPESVVLGVLPAEARLVGDLLVQDGPDLLRVHDLATSPPAVLVDEQGPRTWTFLLVTPDGSRVVEQSADGTRIRVRETTGGVLVEHGPHPGGLTGVDLAADGSEAVFSTASAPYHRVVHLDLGTVPAGVTEVCAFCGPHARLDDGRLVAGTDVYTVTAGLVGSVPIPGAPNGQPVRREVARGLDAHGFVWWANGVGLDVNGPFDPASPSWAAMSWPGTLVADAPGWTWQQPWYWRLTGPGTATQHHREGLQPLLDGRAASLDALTRALSVGDLLPGTGLVDPALVYGAPAVLLDADPSHPRWASRPCEVYRYAPGTWYAPPPAWICVY